MESYYLERHGSFALPVVIALNQNEVTLGHKETPELKNAPNVSESHAMFLRSCTGEWFIKDLSSMNGVFLNSVRIGSGLYAVKVGDIVGLGSTSGDSDRDYVFIMCNKCTLPLVSSSPGDCSKDHCTESGYLVKEASASNCAGNNVILASKLVDSKRNGLPVFHADVSDSIFELQITKEVVEKEPEESDKEKSENNHVNEIENHVFIKRGKPETPCGDLCDDPLLNTAKNASNFAIQPLFVDSRNYGDKNALTDDTLRKPSDSLIETLPPDIENHKYKNISEVPNSSLRQSDSVSTKTIAEGEKLSSHRNLQNKNYGMKQHPTVKDLKVVLKMYDNIVVETYIIQRRNTTNALDSSGSDVIIPPKHPGHRLRTDSSSDESEEPYAQSHEKFYHNGFSSSAESRAHNGKLCNVSNEHTETKIHENDHTRNAENDSDSSGSDVVTPHKQPGHKLRIDSSSDETEEPYTQSREKFDHIGFSSSAGSRAHNGKLCRVSNEHTETEKHKDDCRCNAENDSDSSGYGVVTSHKQHGHKLRIDSSSSSDETEEPYAQSHEKFAHIGFSLSAGSRAHNGKLCRVSNEHTETERHEHDHRCNAKNDSDSSCSNVIIPHKQHGHILRINSSSDESEKPHVAQSCEKFDHIGFSSSAGSRAHNGKLCRVSNEYTKTEKHKDDCRCNAENDSDSSGADVIIPYKQCDHRLRINSSSSSDESEKPHVTQSHEKFDYIGFSSSGKCRAHTGKPCKVSNERSETEIHEDDHNAQLTPKVKSCASINITSSLNTTEASNRCYTQENEIIVISSDDDDYDYAKNPISIKIKTKPTENDDLYDSDWSHCFADSRDVYEHDVTDEDPFSSDIENFPCSDSVLNSSALRTNVTNHHKHLDDRKELQDLMWEHSAETKDGASEEELLDTPENIENIIKFLNDTGNKQILPEKTFNGSKSEKTVSKTERNDFFCPSAHSGLSDKVERLDVPYSDHVGPQGEQKLQKPMSTNYKKPWLPGNHRKASYSKVEMGSSSKHVEFDIFHHTEHLENEKQHAENSCRSSFCVNYMPTCLEEETGNSKKSSDAILNDLCRRQKEKTLTKTVLTEAMPMQYCSRRKRGREEGFRDQYDDDRPTKNKVVSKKKKKKTREDRKRCGR